MQMCAHKLLILNRIIIVPLESIKKNYCVQTNEFKSLV